VRLHRRTRLCVVRSIHICICICRTGIGSRVGVRVWRDVGIVVGVAIGVGVGVRRHGSCIHIRFGVTKR